MVARKNSSYSSLNIPFLIPCYLIIPIPIDTNTFPSAGNKCFQLQAFLHQISRLILSLCHFHLELPRVFLVLEFRPFLTLCINPIEPLHFYLFILFSKSVIFSQNVSFTLFPSHTHPYKH